MYDTVAGGGHPPTHLPVKPIPSPLDVVAVISNPIRYLSRYRLYRDFERYVEDSGARLTTVECAYGERPFEISDPSRPGTVQVRTNSELWIKESLINIGISRLAADWKYVAWVDADVVFARHDWVQETIQQLQHHPVIQMWSHAQDLGPHSEPIQDHLGFAYCHSLGMPFQSPGPAEDGQYYGLGRNAVFFHPGFAWAARRDAIDDLGGLIDWAVLGAGDHHMAAALIGQVERTISGGLHEAYAAKLRTWQDRAERHIRRNIGFMPGLLLHHFHGKKRDRRYRDRWKILVDNHFDPDRDIKRDSQGLWAIEPHAIGLRDGIKGYLKSRNEDSIDL